jgi:hypothetical protein
MEKIPADIFVKHYGNLR